MDWRAGRACSSTATTSAELPAAASALATAATDWAAACERQELNNRKRASANTAADCNAAQGVMSVIAA